MPSLSKDRPYSEDNVTHQPEDFHSASREQLMASMSHTRDPRKRFNPMQSDELSSCNANKLMGVLDPLPERKGYVEKMRKGMIDAKKFDNPALYLKEGAGREAGRAEGDVSMDEEIKDEMNVLKVLGFPNNNNVIRLRGTHQKARITSNASGSPRRTPKAAATRIKDPISQASAPT